MPTPTVVLHHPHKKFAVIYHNGKLWQLPRLAISEHGWQARQVYRGDVHQLVVAREQSLPDLLPACVPIKLPAAIIGRDFPDFLAWWQTAGRAYHVVPTSDSPTLEVDDRVPQPAANNPSTPQRGDLLDDLLTQLIEDL